MTEILSPPEDNFFLPAANNEHPTYKRIRDGLCHPEAGPKMKTNIEEMWSSYKSIAPTSFREKAQRAFFQRWWEMFIGIFLMESGFKITVARNDAGPDFRFIFQGATFVVEATAPQVSAPQINGGQNNDSSGNAVVHSRQIPDDLNEPILKMTGALRDKMEQRNKWIADNVIAKNDVFIVALSPMGIKTPPWNLLGDLDVTCPFPLMFLSGAGVLKLVYDLTEKKIADRHLSPRNDIEKRPGVNVGVSIFDDPAYPALSAVMYSVADPYYNKQKVQVFLNPNASTPLPQGVFSNAETWFRTETEDGFEWKPM